MKRIAAFLICISLLLCFFSPSFAAETQQDPIIHVTGFMGSTLTKNLGKSDEEDVMFPEAKIIAKAIAGTAPAYTSFRISDDYRAFANAICEAGETVFEGIRFDKNGNSVYNVSVKEKNVVTSQQERGKRNFFYYDWRNDVTQTADLLNKYINDILKATNRKKAALVCNSMGGCVGSAYICKYGTDKLSSILLSSSAAMGVEFFADMLCGKLDLDEKRVYNYLVSLDLLKKVSLPESTVKIINSFGYDQVLKDIAKAVSQNEDVLYERLVVPFLSRFPGVWSFVKQSRIAECKKAAGIESGSELEKKIDNYLFSVRPKIVSTLYIAKEKSVKLAILSSYGKEAVESLGNQTYQSDGLIATSDTSLGATCCALGKTFLSSYSQNTFKCHYHVSPDRIIDASTCAFPDNTWFVKGAPHAFYKLKFLDWIAYTDGEVNVYSNEKYPQFMKYEEDGSVTAVDYKSSDILLSAKPKLYEGIVKMINAIKKLFRLFKV